MVVGKGGGDAGVDGLLRLCYDLDEDVHQYHVLKILTPAQAKIERAKLLKERNKAVFNGGASKPVFRTVRRNGRVQVIMMRRKMNWRPSGVIPRRLVLGSGTTTANFSASAPGDYTVTIIGISK